MLLYRCVISDDEVVSDAYPIKQVANGVAVEVDCKVSTPYSVALS